MFMITGPGSPSVLSNMPVSIEQHIDWIADFLQYIREHDIKSVEADADAETAWVTHVNEVAEPTMYMLANSWYATICSNNTIRIEIAIPLLPPDPVFGLRTTRPLPSFTIHLNCVEA